MKKIIILSVLLSTGHAYSIKTEEKFIITAVIAYFVVGAIYEHIKEQNMTPAEKNARQQQKSRILIEIGNRFK